QLPCLEDDYAGVGLELLSEAPLKGPDGVCERAEADFADLDDAVLLHPEGETSLVRGILLRDAINLRLRLLF
ncbi:MAG: hypothetical protein Q8N51_13820, partial [Gammaproteobacteria bacterium]|nr:hypothetical protein [Gammaproteobacteria bacterium]